MCFTSEIVMCLKHIFSKTEIEKLLCASFCCKEALYKAIGTPYNFNECEFFIEEPPFRVIRIVADSLKKDVFFNKIIGNISFIKNNECLATIYVF